MSEWVEACYKLVCFQARYVETSPQRCRCMETVNSVANDIERKATLRRISEGLDVMAVRRRCASGGVVCTTYGLTTC